MQTISQGNTTHLNRLGWSPFFQDQLGNEDIASGIARVIGVRRNSLVVSQGASEMLVTVSGSITNTREAAYPAVGDWVLLQDSFIITVLARQNALVRKESGRKKHKENDRLGQDQVIAANLDRVFIVCGLDRDFNLRRIERYLTLVYNCGISPEIILTKADLHQNPGECLDEVETVACGVPVYLVSARDDEGVLALKSSLPAGETAALIGSSGAGKSTLINRLYGKDIQTTGSVSENLGKGKHTTTNRDLIILPTGGMLIDNPGIREVALAAGDANSLSAFPDIEKVARSCRYLDCTHTHEPGCQVLIAVSNGELNDERLKSYQKIRDELRYISDREVKSAARVERERWKGVAQKIKTINKKKYHR